MSNPPCDPALPAASSARVTMQDVAHAAGVSQSTVSFVLNGQDAMRIAPATRARVLEAANALGYRRRGAGRPAKARAARAIGLMVDEIATSPFASISIEAAQEEAWKAGALLEVAMTGGDRDYENRILERWSAAGIGDVIYAAIFTRTVRPPEGLRAMRSALLNCRDAEGALASITPAERRGGAAATHALLDGGARRIAFIAGEPWMEAAEQRRVGYERALAERGAGAPIVAQGNFLPNGGRAAAHELLERSERPDGIFCANDLTALGCYFALRERGLAPGRDVAVVGYDDSELAQHLEPPLSSVVLPHREMGRWCVRRLLEPPGEPASERRVECALAPRSSHLLRSKLERIP